MSKEIIEAIVNKNFNKAKELINESMNSKIGLLLEEKLEEYAPTIFEQEEVPPTT